MLPAAAAAGSGARHRFSSSCIPSSYALPQDALSYVTTSEVKVVIPLESAGEHTRLTYGGEEE